VPVARRVAVVTGGSNGIGAAIARSLARRSWRCVLLARGEERLRAIAAEVDGEYERCDVGDREAVERVAAAIRERHSRIHLLVNNAGTPARGDFLDATAEEIERVTRVNYLGGIWCLRGFLPALEAAAPSHLVNVVSVAGTFAAGGMSGVYSASKHAQLAFSRSVTGPLAARGIRVHTVNPGFVHTDSFPNRSRVPAPLSQLVVEPELVGERVARMLERGRQEIFVPGWYRPAAVLQAAAPAMLSRLFAARESLRRRS
jgi:short-subunit dehydrogenase